MTVATIAPRRRARRMPPEPPHAVTKYALDVTAGRIVTGKLVRQACERHLRDLAEGPRRGLIWDSAAADRAIGFFPLLRHYKGQWGPRAGKPEGDPIDLEPWQRFIVGSAFGWKRADGLRRFRNVYVEVAKKNGKALALDTPIPTPTGWTTMGELRVGDQVIDEGGRPTTVTFATEVMQDHDCYEVRFSDGTAVIADADHQWYTEELQHRYRGSVKTTADLAATLAMRADGALNHRIPVAKPLELPVADLPVDPYVLGVWLGDGDSMSAMLTVADQQILDEVAAAGVSVGAAYSSGGRTPRYLLGSGGRSQAARNASLQADLRRLGVLGNKHIPAAYLRASADQRLALLQGLMDTDGHATSRGQSEFTTVRPQLRDGVLELARSLGLKPTCHRGMASLDGRVIGEKWRIQFWSRRELPAFRLARKRLRLRAAPGRPTRSMHRHIVSVRPVPSVAVRCIQVDSSSHLFLAGRAMVPTHNTLMAAGIGILLAFFDDEPGAEVYAGATKRDQAKLVWLDAVEMVKKNLGLRTRIKVGAVSLSRPIAASKFQPLGKDSDTDQGINVHGAIIDELHVHEDRDLIDNLETATSARSQPMIVKITTAGVKRESVWAEERADAVAILEGRAEDDATFAIIYTLDEGDDPFDEAVWPKANPNLGVSVLVDTLRQQAAKAKRQPGALAAYLRFRMNVATARSTRGIDLDAWDAGAAEPQVADGQGCYAGLDLATVRDLTAFVMVFRDPLDSETAGTINIVCRFWCPQDGIDQRSEHDGVPYQLWVEQGHLIATEGTVTDYDVVREEISALAEKYTIGEIGFDKWNATQLATQLMNEGAQMVAIPQTYAGLSAATKELDKLVASGKVRHGGHPILRWMASHVEFETDPQENIRPSKKLSRERIDGIAALVMAIARWVANGEEPAVWTAA
jgi:phage terminase large subunit-like protein